MNKFVLLRDHDIVIERISAQALMEARRAANAARRSVGQILRRDREKRPA
jgi:hypothetical protein